MTSFINDNPERYILVAVSCGDEEAAWDSLDELADLLDTAGGETVFQSVQNLAHPDRATYIGKGKAEELRDMMEIHEADGIICDDELTASQMRNLSEITGAKVIDRTTLILDIFAAHAKTREGKLQVEIAQQKYRYARLRGMGEALSRLGAGIGTRGPGETKLETDRRVIRERIGQLKRELAQIVQNRETQRMQRERASVKTVAIVGYTNAGKSTLLNTLTEAGVLEEDKLFATLDTTTRMLALESGQEILLTDTVGFIRKLPHHLVEAFRSTLEEAVYADVLIHVVDVSNPQMYEQMHICYETLDHLGVKDKKIITLFNKVDAVAEADDWRDFRADYTIMTSLKTGVGVDRCKACIEEILREDKRLVEKLFTYEEAGLIQEIRRNGELLSEEYRPDGIFVQAYVPAEIYGRIMKG